MSTPPSTTIPEPEYPPIVRVIHDTNRCKDSETGAFYECDSTTTTTTIVEVEVAVGLPPVPPQTQTLPSTGIETTIAMLAIVFIATGTSLRRLVRVKA